MLTGLLTSLVIGLTSGVIYALLAVGIVLVYRGSRVLNFAQGEIGTFALYIAWLVTNTGLPWIAGAVAAVVAAALLGLGFERLVVNPMAQASRVSVAVATIGLLTFLVFLEGMLFSPNPRTLPLPIKGLGVSIFAYYVSPIQVIGFGVAIALGLSLTALLRFTDFGLSLRAAAEDQATARLVGIKVGWGSAFTWTAASAIAAIAALLIEPSLGVFAPGYISRIFVFALAAALVGGLTSLPGAFIGGLVVGVLDAEAVYALRSPIIGDLLGTRAVPGIDTLAIFVIILAILLLRPGGIFAGRAARLA
ncbi:MAG: branched-chain amino acid ABC transporter permease [Candidatus Dormibacteria bacterium]